MRAWGRPAAGLAAALIIGVAAAAAPAARGGPTTDRNPARPFSQGCLDGPGDRGPARVAWNRLRNPILRYHHAAVRDIGVRLRHGRWHMLFTDVTGSAPTWQVAESSSAGLRAWSRRTVWPHQLRTVGVASPDITRRPDGAYVATYESNPSEVRPRGQDKAYYRLSRDLVHWSRPHRLLAHLHARPEDRVIDPALAWTEHGLFLGYKYGVIGSEQHFEIAWSPSGSLRGPWHYVGRPDIGVYGGTIENYEFLEIDGVWSLLGTSNNLDRPEFFRLRGDPSTPKGWLDWSRGRELEIPLEPWNRAAGVPGVNFDEANSAYLCDARAVDGWYYLFYIGSSELKRYGGWGHTEVGVARSKDLVVWQVPCGRHGLSTYGGCVGA